MKNRRAMWRPKLPELAEQCVSCPFRTGNDKEFGAILSRLRTALMPSNKLRINVADIRYARLMVKADLHYSGDFICHGTAYDADMELRPENERRQCPGATAFFRGQKLETRARSKPGARLT